MWRNQEYATLLIKEGQWYPYQIQLFYGQFGKKKCKTHICVNLK